MKERETDQRIKALVSEVASGRHADLMAEMIDTVLRFGKDHAAIADLKLFNRAFRELRYAASIFSKYNGVRKVAVFGSARTHRDAEEFRLAREFGRLMVEKEWMVITGGGDGIMGAAQEGAGREKSFGLNIQLPFEQKANQFIHGDPKLINFRYFFTRKLNFVKETHAFALFPGGFGTHDEGFEALTLMQTGKSPIVPIVFIDRPNGHYWETWRRFLDNDLLEKGLVSPSDFNLFYITHDVEDAAREICDFYRNFHSYRWVRQQMVIRIQHKLTDAALQKLNDEFSSITTEGQIIQTRHLPEEAEDVHLHHFHRIVLTPDKRDFGMLRMLLNAINDAETVPPEA